ncbi:hypothetical protein D1007_58328 [Hordeum vulgare]|uniref:F-box domain-containing protein n=1 Tax=Hordeum vulgare subsp. vulgare TaxID=112509 RepID=A0A8I6YGZ6_HORVV|nr:hypothetical protein D1007_58328 [Hordeum vulgare]
MASLSQRIRYSKKKRPPPPPPPPERDWAELHPDLISCILHRLDQAELLVGGAAGVCSSWRRAAREEPELWRRIDLREVLPYVPPFCPRSTVNAMVRKALRLGAGQTEAVFLNEGVSDHTLLRLAQRAPSLKSLHLITCSLSNHGFAKAIKMLPLLEELEISQPLYLDVLEMVELVAETCLQLKHFRLVIRGYEDSAVVASMVARMHKLRSLHLVWLVINNDELATILDKCHDLEYLNVPYCSLVDMDAMDDNLQVKLAQINLDDHEYSSDRMVDYEYRSTRIYYEINCRDDGRYYDEYYEEYYDEYYEEYYDNPYDSYDEYCYYIDSGDGIDDADLEEYEKILDIKSMRRYLS